MALISATDYKVQTAAIAVALTAAFKDSGATRIADVIRDPRHPLRDIMRYMTLNPATGVYTSNDDEVDAVYAGKGSAHSHRKEEMSVSDIVGLALNNATVEDAAPSDLVLTFNTNVSGGEGGLVTVAAVPVATIDPPVIAGNVVTIKLATPIVFGDVITVGGTTFGVSLNQVIYSAVGVTNNVAA